MIASFATVPASLISHVVDASFFNGERRTVVAWDYRYAPLEVTSTTEWAASRQPPSSMRLAFNRVRYSARCAGRTSRRY